MSISEKIMEENKKSFFVYKHTNKINGKVYIGITSRKDVKIRWGTNGSGYKNNEHFYNAIKKYGWENFDHEILYSGVSKERALYLEGMFSEIYRSTDPLHGYNLVCGEDNTIFNISEETRNKLSATLSGGKRKPLSKSAKKRLSKIAKKMYKENGYNNPIIRIDKDRKRKSVC